VPGATRAMRWKISFRKGNLIALRELALRKNRGPVDAALRAISQRTVDRYAVGPRQERVLVALGPRSDGESPGARWQAPGHRLACRAGWRCRSRT